MQAMDTAPQPQPAFAAGPGGERSVMARRPARSRNGLVNRFIAKRCTHWFACRV